MDFVFRHAISVLCGVFVFSIVDAQLKTNESIQFGDYNSKSYNNNIKESMVLYSEEIKPLVVGEKVPNILLNNIIEFGRPTKKAMITDFKGKLLILSFWSTWCPVCLEQFPKLENLQSKYAEQIVILPVGFDAYKEGAIKEYLLKSHGTKYGLNLPCLIQSPSDKILEKLFPFSALPHEVWIDKDGVVVGITDHHAVNEKNISDILAGKKVNLPLKKQVKIYIDTKKSYLLNTDCNIEIFGSAFSGFIDTLGCISSYKIYRSTDSTYRYEAANQTVFDYYREAYQLDFSPGEWFTNRKVIVDPTIGKFYEDWKSREDNQDNQEFRTKNLFSYQLRLPKHFTYKEAYNYMKKDLDKYFSVQSTIKHVSVPCLILIRTTNSDRIKSSLSLKDFPSIREKDQNLIFKGVPIKEVINYLNSNHYLDVPFVVLDETKYKDPVDLTIPFKVGLNKLNDELKKYDLCLIKAKRIVRVVYLEKK